jgi:predicted phage terminase large subunit-like protein
VVLNNTKPVPPIELARGSPMCWAIIASQFDYGWWPALHHKFMAAQLDKLISGEILRLVISAPPRHGKSELISRFFAGWWLGTHPHDRRILVSMKERLSRKYTRAVRNDLARLGEKAFGVTCHRLASTTQFPILKHGELTGGSFLAIGCGGGLPGEGADILLVDDLVSSRKQMESQAIRDDQWDWFESALCRLHPPGRVIVISTRWHHDDVIGRLQRKQREGELLEPWTFVNLQALAEDQDPLGRKPGEPLWPEKGYTQDWLLKQANAIGGLGGAMWESNYQGRPSPLGGSVFKKDWFKYYNKGANMIEIPGRGVEDMSYIQRFITVDLAATKKTSADYTAIATWLWHPRWHLLILLDLVRQRMGGHEVTPALMAARQKCLIADPSAPTGYRNMLTAIYVERVGPLLEEKLGDVMKNAAAAGLPVFETIPSGDKEARARAASDSFKNNQVWFPQHKGNPFMNILESEMLEFPEGRYDDQVDVVSQAVGLFRDFEIQYVPKPKAGAVQHVRRAQPRRTGSRIAARR